MIDKESLNVVNNLASCARMMGRKDFDANKALELWVQFREGKISRHEFVVQTDKLWCRLQQDLKEGK